MNLFFFIRSNEYGVLEKFKFMDTLYFYWNYLRWK